MCSFSVKLERKQAWYRAFLQRKFHVYGGWQSFDYYSELYLTLFDETSNSLIQFLLLEDSIFENEHAVLRLFDSFLDQLVRVYDLKFYEDFEKKVYFEEYSVGMSEVNCLRLFDSL
ncbi:hypothetical protein [Enterococcus faecalis]|uniref:Uncharacterized protein n=1 Tax=Enterococcus faecalis RP2S-4 TaxID=1244145 RepID=A0ABC9TI75_ENTFL|nr:hypothetical protein [Enterococcus faecalis]EPI07504.1 hypothetical protein D358_01958 [Enterococcus faecalis RP2S-4]